jgi:hypothetical protein
MANTILTADQITRESLRVLHQKLRFLGSINRGYDNNYAMTGAKIGDTLRIRMPNRFRIRTGRQIATQDVSEQYVNLQISDQAGVDMNFTSAELTLELDDFSNRYIVPAMATVASYMENAVLTARYKDVFNLVDHDGTAVSLLSYLLGKQKLDDNLAPEDDQRVALLSTTHQVKLVDQLKGLFNAQDEVSRQYKEGRMGHAAGFDFFSSTHVLDHTTGTAVKGDTVYNVNGANQTGSTLTVNAGSTTFLKGDVITIAGVNRVHPETKVDTGVAQQFVITADSGASATSLAISPAITVTGAYQNVSGSPTDTGAVTKVGAGNAEKLNSSMVYHKDAFTMATADLILPEGVHFAAREVFDGISMRIVRAYDINNDQFPCRIDVLFGSATLRPEHAARIHADG